MSLPTARQSGRNCWQRESTRENHVAPGGDDELNLGKAAWRLTW
jgi:hypothetical protein